MKANKGNSFKKKFSSANASLKYFNHVNVEYYTDNVTTCRH